MFLVLLYNLLFKWRIVISIRSRPLASSFDVITMALVVSNETMAQRVVKWQRKLTAGLPWPCYCPSKASSRKGKSRWPVKEEDKWIIHQFAGFVPVHFAVDCVNPISISYLVILIFIILRFSFSTSRAEVHSSGGSCGYVVTYTCHVTWPAGGLLLLSRFVNFYILKFCFSKYC